MIISREQATALCRKACSVAAGLIGRIHGINLEGDLSGISSTQLTVLIDRMLTLDECGDLSDTLTQKEHDDLAIFAESLLTGEEDEDEDEF